MNEQNKTLSLLGGAIALALLAWATAPRATVPDAFADRGEAFFSGFEDPNAAATLEVVKFDEETGAADVFKVVNEAGKWTIPSHHDYPADGADRLAQTAAGVIGIQKDDFRSDNVSDHEALGVIDPLDEGSTTLKGRGQRVTLKDASGSILADFIVGKEPEERTGFRFVRIPGQKRVYAARVDLDISTAFEDWIEKDLLKLESADVERILVKDYSIDERSGMLDQRDEVTLTKDDADWQADRMRADQQIDGTKMRALLSAVADLQIVGVRPKPRGLSATLRREEGSQLTNSDVRSLQSRGYYFTRDGQLVSNEGELQVQTKDGVLYTLRFGEVVYGSGETLTAGADTEESGGSGPGENRYLFITTEYQGNTEPEPAAPSDTTFQDKSEEDWTEADKDNKKLFDAHVAWETTKTQQREKAESLNRRFADWYYVIAADAFEKIHLTRKDLVQAKS
jgi:hypothetical protein